MAPPIGASKQSDHLWQCTSEDASSSQDGNHFTPNWPVPDNPAQARRPTIKDIAAEKLQRQADRIAQAERLARSEQAQAGASKAKSRAKAKAWKPFDFTDPGEDFRATREDGRGTPFDVHAKIFQPNPASRPSTSHGSITTGVESSDGVFGHDLWQTVGKQTVAAASGLNAYQIHIENKTPTVAASFNKHAINEVFGNDLPSPTYCQSHTGHINGHVQFCMHPNGDVSAHQWSGSLYQWINIGQYSNIRKKTEGQLANERLRGETELQSLHQNTLAYFRALAKQREASVMGVPFGLKEIQACLPNLQIKRSLTTEKEFETPSRVQLIDHASDLMQQLHTPTYGSMGARRLSGNERYRHATGSVIGSEHHFSSYDGQHSAKTSAEQAQREIDRVLARTAIAKHETDVNSAYPVHARYDYPSRLDQAAWPPRLSASVLSSGYKGGESMARFDSGVDADIFDSRTPQFRNTYESRHRNSMPSGVISQRSTESGRLPESAPLYHPSTSAQPGRLALKDMLQKIGDSASARGSASASGSVSLSRTVLHDPLQASPYPTTPSHPSRSTAYRTQSTFTESPFYATPTKYVPQLKPPPGLAPLKGDLRDLRDSEPEGDWRGRPVDVLEFRAPYMSNEELLLNSKPTPQNFNGPFFTRSLEQDRRLPKKSPDEKLNDWFHGNQTDFERHEALYRQVCNANNTDLDGVSKAKRDPGVIGPSSRSSSSSTKSSAKPKPEPEFDPTVTRLLIPLLENLMSYTSGPPSQRRSFFAPFTNPPDWAIDKSPNGNQSFFEAEWGQPPARIGRDERFKAVTPFGARSGGPMAALRP